MKIDELKTPFYCVSTEEIEKNENELKKALSANFFDSIIGYSFKTNSLPWIINKMKLLGCYAEVVSPDEFELAKEIGFTCDKIIYNGPIKSKETLLEAIKNGSIVNIETKRELRWIGELPSNFKYSIGIRINVDIEKMCPQESAAGNEGGRFGFSMDNEELGDALNCINKYGNFSIRGIHLHTSSKSRGLNVYNALSLAAVNVLEKFNLELDYVDIGGGFFGGLPTKPSFQRYMEVIKNNLSKVDNFKKLTLIVEPGAAIIASAISYYTSVVDVKKTNYNVFVTTDGSRIDIDPLMQKNNYLYEIEYKNDIKRDFQEKQVIAGFTCMEHDRLFSLENNPILCENDRIIYRKVGSYTMSLTPLFIRYFPDIYLEECGKIFKIRDKWNVKEYIQKGKIDT